MILARVIGQVWATQKSPRLASQKLLLLKPLAWYRPDHACDHLVAVDPVAEGDLAGFLTMLRDMGYDGPVTVKPSRNAFQSRRRDVVVIGSNRRPQIDRQLLQRPHVALGSIDGALDLRERRRPPGRKAVG